MRVVRTGHFFKGRMVGGWEFEVNDKNEVLVSQPPRDTDLVYLPEDGRVIINGVEIAPWTRARRQSMDGKEWVEV